MRSLLVVPLVILFLQTVPTGCSDNPDEGITAPILSDEYLGESPPGSTPVLFAPGVFTHEMHSPPVFSPDGSEVYWQPMNTPDIAMKFMQMLNGSWTSPANVPFWAGDLMGEPYFRFDGNRLFFISRRESGIPSSPSKQNIWCVERDGESWSAPQVLGQEVNAIFLRWTFSMTQAGDLYYGGSEVEGEPNDIFVSRFVDGSFAPAEKVPGTINTDGFETTPFVAPDESYLIFSRITETSPDLFVSFKNPDGSWDEPVPMTGLNTGGNEQAPFVTYDGEYLFFLSSRSGLTKAYWVDADVIETYR